MLARVDIQLSGPQRIPVPAVLDGEAMPFTVRVLTVDLATATPSTARYRIDDLVQGNAVVDWTSITPANPMSVIVTGAQNALRNGRDRERRIITVEATDADGPRRSTLEYDVLGIPGLS